jgi:segregation and condensation protein A
MSESAEKEVSYANNQKKVGQEQIHDLLFGKEMSWQSILYDLINTEQLDPWDIDISLLSERYLERIKELEETNYMISSKVLLAAALLLYLKSEILLNQDLKSIDEILFGRKEEKRYSMERIELDEDVPELLPRSPLPRLRKISLQELMQSLEKAIATENRRIRKHILEKNALRESAISLPKGSRINVTDKIKELYIKIQDLLKDEEKQNHIPYAHISGSTKEEKIASFLPLLHLDNQKKIWLQQDEHFGEINIWLSKIYKKHHDIYEEIRKEMEIIEDELNDIEDNRPEALEIVNEQL